MIYYILQCYPKDQYLNMYSVMLFPSLMKSISRLTIRSTSLKWLTCQQIELQTFVRSSIKRNLQNYTFTNSCRWTRCWLGKAWSVIRKGRFNNTCIHKRIFQHFPVLSRRKIRSPNKSKKCAIVVDVRQYHLAYDNNHLGCTAKSYVRNRTSFDNTGTVSISGNAYFVQTL